MTTRLMLLFLAVAVGSADVAVAAQLGLWQLNNNLDNHVNPALPLVVHGGWTTEYVSVDINGVPATALAFPAFTNIQSLQMPNANAMDPESGGLTGEWTIIMDVNFPSIDDFVALWQTDEDISASDGDFFIRDDGGIGISGSYHGHVAQNTWTRIAVVRRHVSGQYSLEKFINGTRVGFTGTGGLFDGRHALADVLNLFADDDGETAAGMVNSLAFFDQRINGVRIRNMGGATADGLHYIPEPGSCTLALITTAMLSLGASGRLRRKNVLSDR